MTGEERMRESIVCIGKMAKVGYRFPETGIQIFSYEELCYYLSQHMICYLYTLPQEELLLYIRDELGLDKLYRQLSKWSNVEKDQMKYFSTLFREGNYFSEDEIQQILDKYRELKNAPYSFQCKWMGDLFLKNERASMAVYYYKRALEQETMKRTEMGAVYHNIGIAQSRMFRFHDAKISFVKAYQYAGTEESLFYYYCIVAYTAGVEKAGEELQGFQISDLMMESFENRFTDIKEDFAYSVSAERLKKIAYLTEKEKFQEADRMYQNLIQKLKRNFRSELEMDENLPKKYFPVQGENQRTS